MTLRSLLIKSGLIIGVFSLLSGWTFAQSTNLKPSQVEVTQSGSSMKLGKAVSNPRLGQEFSIYVMNNGNAQLTNIHIASDNRKLLSIDDNQCATGLSPGDTCQIKITGTSKKLVGTHAINIASKQDASGSIQVHFVQPRIKSNFESSQPFTSGQTVTLDVQAGPPISPDANFNPAQVSYSLKNVQAKPQNGQLIPQNNQSGSNNTCSSSPCKFQFKVKQAKDLQGGQPAKIELTSQYDKTTHQQANLVAMAAKPSTKKPLFGQTFHVTVTNRGNQDLTGVKVTSDKTHLNIKNYCSGGLKPGKQSTCQIDITGNNQDLVGQSKTIKIGAYQATSASTTVHFQKQQGISANLQSDGPFKPGQTVTVTAKPKGQGQIKLPDVTATPQNGQLKPASTSSQTCSNSSPCQFKFTVKKAADLNAGQSAKVKVSSSHAAKSATPSADIEAMTISASQDQAYLGNALPVTVTNKGSVKLSGIGLTSSQDHLSIDNGCQDGLAPGSNSSCTINITGQSKDLVGKQQTIKIGSGQTSSMSTTVIFKQPSMSANIEESGPFKPGQPLEVKVTPKQSGQLKLQGVTAKPQNGQLTSADHASTGKTCSHDSPCHFQFNVKQASQLNANKPAKIKVASQYAQSTMATMSLVAMQPTWPSSKPYEGDVFKVSLKNMGTVKLTQLSAKPNQQRPSHCSSLKPGDSCDFKLKATKPKVNLKIQHQSSDPGKVKGQVTHSQSLKQPAFSLNNVPKSIKVKDNPIFTIQVNPSNSDEVLHGLKVTSMKNLVLNKDKTTCSQGSQQGSCQFAFGVKNDHASQPAQVTIESNNASSKQATIPILALDATWPSGVLNKGAEFKVGVTNQGSVKLNKLQAGGNHIHVKDSDTRCGSSLKKGQSCHFRATSSAADTVMTVSAKGEVANKNIKVDHPIKTKGMSSSVSSQKINQGQTFQLTIHNTGGETLTQLKAHLTSGLRVLSDPSNCDSNDGLKSGDKCHFTITSNDPVQSKQTVQPSSQQTGQGQQHTVKINLLHLQASHTMVTKPDSQDGVDNYFVVTNAAFSDDNGALINIDNIEVEYNDQLGGGIKLDDSEEAAQQSGDQLKTCQQINYSLNPGQSCRVPFTAKHNAHGTVLVKVIANIVGGAKQFPINVVDPQVHLTKDDGYDFTYNKHFKKYSGNPKLDLLAWAGPTKSQSGSRWNATSNINIHNDGPFSFKLKRAGEMFPKSNSRQSLIDNKCKNNVIKAGGDCSFQINMSGPHGKYEVYHLLAGVATFFNHDTHSEPLVALPVVNQACGFKQDGPDWNPTWYPNDAFTILLRKVPDRENMTVNQAKCKKGSDVDCHKHFEPSHLMQINGIYVPNLQQGQTKGVFIYVGRKAPFSITSRESPSILSMTYTPDYDLNTQLPLDIGNSPKSVAQSLNYHMQFTIQQSNLPIKAWYKDRYISLFPNMKASVLNDQHQYGARRYPYAFYRKLVVGGDFTHIKGVPDSTAIAAYGPVRGASDDKNIWHSLATLSAGDEVNTMAMGPLDFYAAGQFSQISIRGHVTQANNIAYYNGAQWRSLGDGVTSNQGSAQVNALAVDSDHKVLYVGGRFTQAGSKDANNLAKWNISKQQWDTLSQTPQDGSVNAMLLGPNNGLWVGGDFTQVANHTNSHGLAAYNVNGDKQWSALGHNLKPVDSGNKVVVNTLAYIPKLGDKDPFIIAAGRFKICNSDGQCSYGLAVYNLDKQENGWKPFYPQANVKPKIKSNNDSIQSLKLNTLPGSDEARLYIGGSFTLQGQPKHFVSFYFKGAEWQTPSLSPNGTVKAQVLTKNNLYIGGGFSNLDSESISDVAKKSLQTNNDFWQALTSNAQTTEVERGNDIIKGGAIKSMAIMSQVTVSPKQNPLSRDILYRDQQCNLY